MDGVTFKIYSLEEDQKVTQNLVNAKGENVGTVSAIRQGQKVTVTTSGLNKSYHVEVPGYKKVSANAGEETIEINL